MYYRYFAAPEDFSSALSVLAEMAYGSGLFLVCKFPPVLAALVVADYLGVGGGGGGVGNTLSLCRTFQQYILVSPCFFSSKA